MAKLPLYFQKLPNFNQSLPQRLLPNIWRREKPKGFPERDFSHAPKLNNIPSNTLPLLLTQEKTLEKSPPGRGRRANGS
jgi:hypothetical protein